MLTDPLDLLKTYLKENVLIRLKSGEEFNGVLEGFDDHHNIVLNMESYLKFIRGENIIFIGQK